MCTTTIRVDTATHARLTELSEASGASLVETVRDAVEALRRQRFAGQVAAELSDLSSHPTEWDDYVGEADVPSVADGVR